jgi:cell division protein FtsW (lipid II flippase)
VVVAAGVAVRAPLARVPENTIKLVVGLMLSTYGTFWAAEGAGAQWPAGDVFLLVVAAWLLLAALALASAPVSARLRAGARARPSRSRRGGARGGSDAVRGSKIARPVVAVAHGAWEFVVGDDWQTAAAVVIALSVTALLAAAGIPAWWVLPLAVPVVLAWSVRRAARGAADAPRVAEEVVRPPVAAAR